MARGRRASRDIDSSAWVRTAGTLGTADRRRTQSSRAPFAEEVAVFRFNDIFGECRFGFWFYKTRGQTDRQDTNGI